MDGSMGEIWLKRCRAVGLDIGVGIGVGISIGVVIDRDIGVSVGS